MTITCLISPIVALLLLSAHFFRAGSQAMMLLSLLLIALVFVRRPWAARLMQISLLLGAVEWVRSAIALAHARIALGQPFTRLALILGGVSLFTALCAFLLRLDRTKRYFAGESAG